MSLIYTLVAIGGFFREAGKPPAARDLEAPPRDSEEITRTERAGQRYGLQAIDWDI
ncbi:MAG: hypothetical protein M3261_05550 [Thermoproteota archaeon]|nr:hypothetical protein [Thermoproteota archaeon]